MRCNLIVCDRCEEVIKDDRIMIRITHGGNATIAKFDLCKKCQREVLRVLYNEEDADGEENNSEEDEN